MLEAKYLDLNARRWKAKIFVSYFPPQRAREYATSFTQGVDIHHFLEIFESRQRCPSKGLCHNAAAYGNFFDAGKFCSRFLHLLQEAMKLRWEEKYRRYLRR